MYYYIRNSLEKAEHLNFTKKNSRYVAVLTSAEWLACKDQFDMGIEMDIDLNSIHSTKAEVNYDSLTGSFCIPDRNRISEPNTKFAFALDEKGIVFIDDSGYVAKIIDRITACKRWAVPSLERFIYDFLEQIVSRDQITLEKFDQELDSIESGIMEGGITDPSQQRSPRYAHPLRAASGSESGAEGKRKQFLQKGEYALFSSVYAACVAAA